MDKDVYQGFEGSLMVFAGFSTGYIRVSQELYQGSIRF